MRIVASEPERLEISVLRLGDDRNPVVVVDNVLANPDEVREHALASQFSAGSRRHYYPGYRSHCALPGLTAIVQWIGRYAWSQVYGLGEAPFADFDGLAADAFFALFAPDPSASFINQHADGNSSWLAAIIYLSEARLGAGTAFWRHRRTGIQSLPEPDIIQIQKLEALFGVKILDTLRRAFVDSPTFSMEQVMSELHGRETSRSFEATSTEDWELLEIVPQKFNRMIFYPTWQVHSIAYPNYAPPKSPAEARLTLNTFVDFPVRGIREYLPVAPVPGLLR